MAEGWWTVSADLSGLGTWLPVFRMDGLPKVHLTVSGEGEYLRTQATLDFAERIPWVFEPWQIPTNTISDPIVSFTVGQGLAPVLAKWFPASSLGLEKLPSQVCIWGVPTTQQQTFFTMPVDDGSNTLAQLVKHLPEAVGARCPKWANAFLYETNTAMLYWQVCAPPALTYLRVLKEQGQDYIMGGVVPLTAGVNPPPSALFAQLSGRTNLLYYDWEITEMRAISALQLYQLWGFRQRVQSVSQTEPTEKWMYEARKMLGNAVTEVTQESPRQLRLVRKSHLGLTGTEFVMLIRWIESPGFPLTFDAPPPYEDVPSGVSPQR